MKPDLTISLINHSNPDLLHDCLASLYRATQEIRFDVWVVDNATTGRGITRMKADFPAVRWIMNDRRQGFSANHNQVLRQARGRHVCILNDDTFIHDGALDRLVAYLDAHPDVGMVGPRLLNADGTQQDCVFRFPTLLTQAIDLSLLPRAWMAWKRIGVDERQAGTQPLRADWVLGACIVVRQEALQQIGLLDEALSPLANTEDIDWCYRAWQAGWAVAYEPHAVITHLGGQSTRSEGAGPDRVRVELHRTHLAFFRKHYGRLYAFALRCVQVLVLPWNGLMLAQGMLRRPAQRTTYRRALRTQWHIARQALRRGGKLTP